MGYLVVVGRIVESIRGLASASLLLFNICTVCDTHYSVDFWNSLKLALGGPNHKGMSDTAFI